MTSAKKGSTDVTLSTSVNDRTRFACDVAGCWSTEQDLTELVLVAVRCLDAYFGEEITYCWGNHRMMNDRWSDVSSYPRHSSYMCICVHVSQCLCACRCVCVCVCVYVYACVCARACVRARVCARMCGVYECVYVCARAQVSAAERSHCVADKLRRRRLVPVVKELMTYQRGITRHANLLAFADFLARRPGLRKCDRTSSSGRGPRLRTHQ